MIIYKKKYAYWYAISLFPNFTFGLCPSKALNAISEVINASFYNFRIDIVVAAPFFVNCWKTSKLDAVTFFFLIRNRDIIISTYYRAPKVKTVLWKRFEYVNTKKYHQVNQFGHGRDKLPTFKNTSEYKIILHRSRVIISYKSLVLPCLSNFWNIFYINFYLMTSFTSF